MGIPRLLTSDNGKEFKNKLDEELSKQLGIKRIFTTPYHPQVSFLMNQRGKNNKPPIELVAE